VKQVQRVATALAVAPFSILERIDVGETRAGDPGSIWHIPTFSILERIDVGETADAANEQPIAKVLSVSSNGSTWVKLFARVISQHENIDFQYPRTDRRG